MITLPPFSTITPFLEGQTVRISLPQLKWLQAVAALQIPEFANETPTGAADGVNTLFALAHAPNPRSSLQLFDSVIGTLLLPSTYTLNSHGTLITFTAPPTVGHVPYATYRY